MFQRHPDPTRPDEALLKLLKLGLLKNDFEFNDQFYLQVHGTAMGKKSPPAYANIYMADWEHTVFPKCIKLPNFYIRYLDDIFGIWTHSRAEFSDFYLGPEPPSPSSSISVKFNIQSERIEFVVVLIPHEEGQSSLGTRVYFKPTDTHSLLHKTSYHPRLTYRGIVKSQLIRYDRICTRAEDLEVATRTLLAALRRRGYSSSFLWEIKGDLRDNYHLAVRPVRENSNLSLVPFISTFSPASQTLTISIKNT